MEQVLNDIKKAHSLKSAPVSDKSAPFLCKSKPLRDGIVLKASAAPDFHLRKSVRRNLMDEVVSGGSLELRHTETADKSAPFVSKSLKIKKSRRPELLEQIKERSGGTAE
eukprot:m51a1_g11737 hypothetical protein (110) ;mRNA; f:140028-140424